jgi:acyl carrier protein
MTNIAKYDECFANAFMLNRDDISISTLEYQGTKQWDSVGHMALVANIEDSFGIMLDMEDVIGFSSYLVGKKILEKYDVTFP